MACEQWKGQHEFLNAQKTAACRRELERVCGKLASPSRLDHSSRKTDKNCAVCSATRSSGTSFRSREASSLVLLPKERSAAHKPHHKEISSGRTNGGCPTPLFLYCPDITPPIDIDSTAVPDSNNWREQKYKCTHPCACVGDTHTQGAA